MTLRDSDDAAPRIVNLLPVAFRTWTKLANDGLPYRQDFGSSVSWKMVGPKTGYLRIDTFVNYRKPVDAAALYALCAASRTKDPIPPGNRSELCGFAGAFDKGARRPTQ